MKRAVSAINCHLNNVPAPLFYKCRMFCFHNDDNNRIDFYENPYYDQPEGYEKDLVNWLKNKNIEEVYSLRFLPEVINQLNLAGIKHFALETQQIKLEELIAGFSTPKIE